jgi:cytochrome P450
MATVTLEGLDPFSREFQQDPFPYYALMRETSPAWHLPGTDLHFITRYDLVSAVLRDTATFSSAYGATANQPPKPHLAEQLEAIRSQGWVRPPTMLTVDPPDHTRYRNTVSKAFNARAIAALRPDIEVIVDEEIARFIDRGVVSFKDVLATPVPVRVIVRALNLAAGHEADIKRWSDDTTASIGADLPDERLIEAQWGILELQRFMHDELEERRRCPQHDVVTALVRAELPLPDGEGTRPLTTEELLGILQQLIGAGNETTTKLFSQMIRNLADNHDEWWRLKADPSRAALVVEEALRLASPTQGLYRKVMRDVDIEGTVVPAGQRVLEMYAAANRDPAAFPEPDRFDPDRANVRNHLAFGGGVHFCIGAPLARLESVIALEKLAQQWEDFRLADGNTFEYEPSFLLRGLKDLTVEFTRAA